MFIAFQLCFRICHQEGPRLELHGTHIFLVCADDVNTLGGNTKTINTDTGTLKPRKS
jgi:hypothetical protein